MAEGQVPSAASTADITAAVAPLATSAGLTAATSPLATLAALGGRLLVSTFNASLIKTAGTYDVFTATGGDVWVEIEIAQVTVAAVGLTSAIFSTNHGTPKAVVASTLLAALLLDASLAIVTPKFILPSGKKLQYTVVGTGSAGNVAFIVKSAPASASGVLA